MRDFIFAKTKYYSRPHEISYGIQRSVKYSANLVQIPLVAYDKGLGAPSSYNAHREHASFAATGGAQCYPDSRIAQFKSQFTIGFTKAALETDKLHALRFGIQVVQMSVLEDYTAKDPLSSLEVEDIIEMQHEDTDYQGYPIFNGNDVVEKYAEGSNAGSAQPGLTTDDHLESGTIDIDQFYDTLQYRPKISGKLKAVQRGIKWYTLTKERPYRIIDIKLGSKSKAMIPYSSMVVNIIHPEVGTEYQVPIDADATTVMHLDIDVKARYNEWNPDFNMAMM